MDSAAASAAEPEPDSLASALPSPGIGPWAHSSAPGRSVRNPAATSAADSVSQQLTTVDRPPSARQFAGFGLFYLFFLGLVGYYVAAGLL